MTVPKHLDEAVARMRAAAERIDDARDKATTPDHLREWLVAVTNYTMALSDVQTFCNESVHEKLRQLSDHVGLGKL